MSNDSKEKCPFIEKKNEETKKEENLNKVEDQEFDLGVNKGLKFLLSPESKKEN